MAKSATSCTVPTFSLRKYDLVTLLIGPDKHEFVVHESCITRNSDFFTAAMKKEWTEGHTRIVSLPEEYCVETFTHYLNFCYHNKLPTAAIENKAGGLFPEDRFTRLGGMYVLGERMLDKSVQHAIIREIVRLSSIRSDDNANKRSFPGAGCVTIIYNGTTAGSPARRLMVDMYVSHGGTGWQYSDNTEFLKDFSKAFLEKTIAQKFVCDFRGREVVVENYIE
jgi:hypothetical protein